VVVVATAGPEAVRPAHAAQVVPSAICAPHVLQNAIGISSSVASSIGSCASGVAAKYQKNTTKAIDNFELKDVLDCGSILQGKIPYPGKLKHSSVKGRTRERHGFEFLH